MDPNHELHFMSSVNCEGMNSDDCDDDDDGDFDGEGGERLPAAVRIALLIIGMGTPSHSEGDVTTSGDDPRRPLLDYGNNNEREMRYTSDFVGEDEQADREKHEEEDIDFISLKFETKKHQKPLKRDFRSVVMEAVMLLYLSLLVSFLLLDTSVYLYAFWGKPSELLYMISYITSSIQLLICPCYSLLCRLSMIAPWLINTIHRSPLKPNFVIRRVRVLRACGSDVMLKPYFLLAFGLWPFIQTVLRAATWAVLRHNCHRSYFFFSDFSVSWGLFVYGHFWYLMRIERVSLHRNLNRLVRDVKRASLTQNVNAARRKIRLVHGDYFVMRELMGVLMAVTMVTGSWGIMSHLSWDYSIYDWETQHGHLNELYLECMIWSEKLMFVVLPCMALGGINLEYLWQAFTHVLERMRAYQHRAFWLAVQLHTAAIDRIGSPELKWTLVFVLAGPYISLQSRMGTTQNLMFWNGPFKDNCTNNSDSFFPVRD